MGRHFLFACHRTRCNVTTKKVGQQLRTTVLWSDLRNLSRKHNTADKLLPNIVPPVVPSPGIKLSIRAFTYYYMTTKNNHKCDQIGCSYTLARLLMSPQRAPATGGVQTDSTVFTCDSEHHAGDLIADGIASDTLVASAVSSAHVLYL